MCRRFDPGPDHWKRLCANFLVECPPAILRLGCRFFWPERADALPASGNPKSKALSMCPPTSFGLGRRSLRPERADTMFAGGQRPPVYSHNPHLAPKGRNYLGTKIRSMGCALIKQDGLPIVPFAQEQARRRALRLRRRT